MWNNSTLLFSFSIICHIGSLQHKLLTFSLLLLCSQSSGTLLEIRTFSSSNKRVNFVFLQHCFLCNDVPCIALKSLGYSWVGWFCSSFLFRTSWANDFHKRKTKGSTFDSRFSFSKICTQDLFVFFLLNLCCFFLFLFSRLSV